MLKFFKKKDNGYFADFNDSDNNDEIKTELVNSKGFRVDMESLMNSSAVRRQIEAAKQNTRTDEEVEEESSVAE